MIVIQTWVYTTSALLPQASSLPAQRCAVIGQVCVNVGCGYISGFDATHGGGLHHAAFQRQRRCDQEILITREDAILHLSWQK